MKILAFERELPNATPEGFQHYAKDEARKAWELYQAGLIRELYFRADQKTVVLVLECASIDNAMNILAKLPYVREELITFDLVPLKAYSGFARIFNEDDDSN